MPPVFAAGPTAVGVLSPAQKIEGVLAVCGPRHLLSRDRSRKQIAPALVAKHVNALSPIVVSVLVITRAAAPKPLPAVLEPLPDIGRIVFACTEGGCNRGRSQGRPCMTRHCRLPIPYTALLRRTVPQVLSCSIDHFFGNCDSRVATSAQGLHLSDCD